MSKNKIQPIDGFNQNSASLSSLIATTSSSSSTTSLAGTTNYQKSRLTNGLNQPLPNNNENLQVRPSTAAGSQLETFESPSPIQSDELSYLQLRPFTRLDPTLVRMLGFLRCFGLVVDAGPRLEVLGKADDWDDEHLKRKHKYGRYAKTFLTLCIAALTSEVVYDVNLRQSKLLAEQKRSTPLLTFVIVAYSWLTLVLPFVCDISLILIGSHLFRFYSRTMATVCNGMFFGKKTTVDTWYYYVALVLIAFLDVVGQVVLLGVWPKAIDYYMEMLVVSHDKPQAQQNQTLSYSSTASPLGENQLEPRSELELATGSASLNATSSLVSSFERPRIRAHLLDFLLGEQYAHSDLGVCLKILFLMVQFVHSYAFLLIIISLANHYASAINTINSHLKKYEFRRLLKQLIIFRDSCEQISLMISIPFSLITMLVFMRQIALNGVFIQSTMQAHENWAVLLQLSCCSITIVMVFTYCDGLQSASKQTHRLKTEQTVINENRGGNQSIYEFLDYLDRLSKSISMTFFNIIAINKGSLVGLYGHIMTLTFVTS